MRVQTPESLRREIGELREQQMHVALFLGRESIQESQLSVYTAQYRIAENSISIKNRLIRGM